MERILVRTKPVIVMYAGLGWSHLIPFLHLAKTFSALDYGFHVFFITQDNNIAGEMEYIQQVLSSCNDAMTVLHVSHGTDFADHLLEIRNAGYPVCAYIVDSMWTGSPELLSFHLYLASHRLRMPTYIFFRHCASFLCLALFKEKLHQGFVGVRRVPGLSSIIPSDLPEALLTDQFPADQIPRASAFIGAKGVIINSWHELESAQIHTLQSDIVMPALYPIGPLIPSWPTLPESQQEPAAGPAAEFLNSQYIRSVLFVSLGPLFVSAGQIRELAVGLEACGHPFLWALKPETTPSSSSSSLSELLPEGFQNRTRDRGLVISCPPPRGYILSHPCTGGFFSHCGWNSTLQSILHGVPIIACPVFDNAQKLNALVLLREMKAAIEAKKEADGSVSGKEVERCGKALMGGEEEGISIRAKMIALSIEGSNATAAGGSSYQAMTSLIAAINSNMPILTSIL